MRTLPGRLSQTFEVVSLSVSILLVLIIAVWVNQARDAFERSTNQRTEILAVFNETNTLLSLLKDAETGERGFLLVGKDRYLEPYRKAVAAVPAAIKALDRHAAKHTPENARPVEQLKPLVNERLALLAEGIQLRRSQGTQSVAALVRMDQGTALMDEIRAICANLEAGNSRILARATEEARVSGARAGYIGVLGSLTVLGILFLSTVNVHRGTRGRQQLIAALQASEQSLMQTRDWLQTTLASIGDAVIATDSQGTITFFNQIAQSVTGWAPGEAVGKPLEQVLGICDEETGTSIENPVRRALREARIVGVTNHSQLRAKDGTSRPDRGQCGADSGCEGRNHRRGDGVSGYLRAAEYRKEPGAHARSAAGFCVVVTGGPRVFGPGPPIPAGE